MNNDKRKLVDLDTGKEINIGDSVVDFRGDKRTLYACFPFDGMNGKVRLTDDDFGALAYPGVINAQFVDV